MMLKAFIISILMIFSFFNTYSQTYGEKKIYIDYGIWENKISDIEKISISSYVTRQNIFNLNFEQKQKTVSFLPKYRYELYLNSSSKYKYKPVKTWIFNTKIYINNTDISYQQFPKGFTVLVDTMATLIYWYETNDDKINIKISWESSDTIKK